MKILVTGASGLIGKNFIREALRAGHEVRALVRRPKEFAMLPPERVFAWTHQAKPAREALAGVDAIVHLAGENIADGRWSERRKRQLVESRLVGTRNLVAAIAELSAAERPKTLVSSSAIGIYGYQREEMLDESSVAGDDFLARLCLEWEREAMGARELGLRVVCARTGVVLSREGGALGKMPPVQVGGGRHWMSWIHIDDMVSALLFALADERLAGPFNCVSPMPVSNRDFTRELARLKGVPMIGFAPRFVLRLVLGELANVILSSLRVVPRRLLEAGFTFQHQSHTQALEKELAGLHPLDSHFFQDQFVPLAPGQVFPFFSRAQNLEALTPPWLNFRIISQGADEVRQGSLIDYRLKIHGVPVRWRTLISHWQDNESFVDEQLKGPYAKWHHRHSFVPVAGGSLLRDEITYRVPGSIFGALLLGGWIRSDVSKIFAYRQSRILELQASGRLS